MYCRSQDTVIIMWNTQHEALEKQISESMKYGYGISIIMHACLAFFASEFFVIYMHYAATILSNKLTALAMKLLRKLTA